LRKEISKGVPSNVEALVGSVGIITQGVTAHSLGRVKVQSEEWRAEAASEFAVGTRVRVQSIEGNTLTVIAVA